MTYRDFELAFGGRLSGGLRKGVFALDQFSFLLWRKTLLGVELEGQPEL